MSIVLLALPAASPRGGTTPFSSAREALKQGVSAYNGGYYEIAIPALEYAAAEDEFMAEYYLARIYADNTGSHTDHAKAYMLFQRIADEHIDADPDDDPRAPYVGKSLTALAGYVRRGLPEIGLKPDPERAVFYLNNASTTFNDAGRPVRARQAPAQGRGDRDQRSARQALALGPEPERSRGRPGVPGRPALARQVRGGRSGARSGVDLDRGPERPTP